MPAKNRERNEQKIPLDTSGRNGPAVPREVTSN